MHWHLKTLALNKVEDRNERIYVGTVRTANSGVAAVYVSISENGRFKLWAYSQTPDNQYVQLGRSPAIS